MIVEELLILLGNKTRKLNNDLISATNNGDIFEINKINKEIEEVNSVINDINKGA